VDRIQPISPDRTVQPVELPRLRPLDREPERRQRERKRPQRPADPPAKPAESGRDGIDVRA
jgi:hypothetical protein